VSALAVLRSADQAAQWLQARVTGELRTDSRQIGRGDGFIAWPGAASDARQYVAQALAQGASACLVESQGAVAWNFDQGLAQSPGGSPIAGYQQLKAATGPIAAAYYGHPSRSITMLAVTGTNGKTSITWWLAQLLQKIEQTSHSGCAVIGTLGIGIPPTLVYNGLTTPDPVLLQQQLRAFVGQGIGFCAIEASSIGIAERRLDGCEIRLGVFTNFTHDHLDYHGSMQAYWQAKAELFRWPGLQAAVINVDDPQGVELAGQLQGTPVVVWTYGQIAAAQPTLLATQVRYERQAQANGLVFEVHEGAQTCTVRTSLIGHYNVSNVLAVVGSLRALGVSLAAATAACAQVSSVPGRMECLGGGMLPLAVVDYAHTPDALDQALRGLRPLAQARGGQLWCVFGCGGDRDAAKRPAMAAIAERQADQIVITSDNPRSEKPETIISQILLGLSHGQQREARVHVEPLRAQAIAHAVQAAAPQDVVLVAGKGHENFQEIHGVRHAFSDQAQVRAGLSHREQAV
jgi:UDP-N-acetylmuramoyl-L-alanyl-D-glutamate--2,6-diaminopimelate ligase